MISYNGHKTLFAVIGHRYKYTSKQLLVCVELLASKCKLQYFKHSIIDVDLINFMICIILIFVARSL